VQCLYANDDGSIGVQLSASLHTVGGIHVYDKYVSNIATDMASYY